VIKRHNRHASSYVAPASAAFVTEQTESEPKIAARLEVFDCGLYRIGEKARNNLMVSRTSYNFQIERRKLADDR
jgi:hypothetical protein